MTDVLSEILAHLDLRGLRCTRLEAAGRWAWRFPARPLVKAVAVLRGDVWLVPHGEAGRHLHEGDTFLLTSARDYVLASERDVPPRDGMRDFDWARSAVARRGGDDVVMLGAAFVVDGDNAGLLLDAFPQVMLVHAGEPSARVLRDCIALLDAELQTAGVGGHAVTRRLAEIVFVQALRAYVACDDGDSAHWLRGLGCPQIGAAMALMHERPAQRWTVAELATRVGMSRAAFAARFREKVGVPPMTYLSRWRMERARASLRTSDVPLAQLASELGYASESAFGLAFKRQYGRSPGHYRRPDPVAPGDQIIASDQPSSASSSARRGASVAQKNSSS